MDLQEIIENITEVSKKDQEKAWEHWDSLCKPLRGLGQLEEMVTQLAAIQQTETPSIEKRAVVVMGADNGVVCEGVTQTGAEVTAQVLENMGDHKSTVCVMAKTIHTDVIPVNIGMNVMGKHPAIQNVPVRMGTGNIRIEPAMTRAECKKAVETGIQVIQEIKEKGYQLIVTGEMGIGNTTTSSACAAVLFDQEVEFVTGRGAGLSTPGLQKKIQVIRDAIALHQPDPSDMLDVISKVGGLDIAGMVGMYLGAAYCQIPILIDGFISSVAAYAAASLCPKAKEYMIATHCSAEPAGKLVMDALQMHAPIQAGMHLGEGSGAIAVLPLLDMALTVYYRLPSWNDGHVEEYQHQK